MGLYQERREKDGQVSRFWTYLLINWKSENRKEEAPDQVFC